MIFDKIDILFKCKSDIIIAPKMNTLNEMTNQTSHQLEFDVNPTCFTHAGNENIYNYTQQDELYNTLKIDYSKWLTATPPSFEEWAALQSDIDKPVLKRNCIPTNKSIDFQNLSEADCSILCENSQLSTDYSYMNTVEFIEDDYDAEMWTVMNLMEWGESGKIYGPNDWTSETIVSETIVSETTKSEPVQPDIWSRETNQHYEPVLNEPDHYWNSNGKFVSILQLPEFELGSRPVHPFFSDLSDCFESNEYTDLEAAIIQEVEKLQEPEEYELEDGEIYEEPPALPKPMTRLIGDDYAYNNGFANLTKEIDRLIHNS